MESLLEKLDKNERFILKSDFYKELGDILPDMHIKGLICLGLGSPSESSQALWQLALLRILGKRLNVNAISVWDPEFNDKDETLFSEIQISIEEVDIEVDQVGDGSEDGDANGSNVDNFYYLPHFPISALEQFISNVKPKYMLSNDMSVYSLKFTDREYFARYPNCCRIAKLMDRANCASQDRSFEIVSRRKNRRSKGKVISKPIDFEFDKAWFDQNKINIKLLPLGNDIGEKWTVAFTDLSLITLSVTQITTGTT